MEAGDCDDDDVTGIGTDDLSLGAPSNPGSSTVRLPGPLSGALTTNDATGSLLGSLQGSPRALGDLDGDGSDELLIGAVGVYADPILAGRICLLQGPGW